MSGSLERQRGEVETESVEKNVLHFNEYRLPYSPMKLATQVDNPPWHLGGEVLHVGLMIEEDRAREFVPQPLEVGPNPGEAAVWFTEWISASETWPDLAFQFPDKAVYRECMILVGCQYRGIRGFFVPYAWVDNDFNQVRGLIQGFPKKADRISLTRLHALNPKTGGKKAGAKVKGVCDSNGQRFLEGTVLFTREAEPSAVPSVKLFLLHRFQTIEDPGRAAVHELTTGRVSDVRITDVWFGEGAIKLFDSPFEDLSGLGPVKVTGGLYFSMGLTIAGGEVVYKYV